MFSNKKTFEWFGVQLCDTSYRMLPSGNNCRWRAKHYFKKCQDVSDEEFLELKSQIFASLPVNESMKIIREEIMKSLQAAEATQGVSLFFAASDGDVAGAKDVSIKGLRAGSAY